MMSPITHRVAPGHYDGDGCVFPSAGHLVPVDPVAAAVMPGAPVHYGMHVTELGDSGEDWAIAGHPTPRRALAAVLRYLRVDCGLDRDDYADLRTARIRQQWVQPRLDEDDDLEWEWHDEAGAGRAPITLVTL